MIAYGLLVIASGVTLWVVVRLVWALRRFKYVNTSASSSDSLPSVSVCIPARNETHALAQCLERVLASNYKKLEILVLDDSSDDDTSLIIRSFAHAGVRFIAGKSLPVGWLGKNHAYQTLAEEASSEYVLFIDVDTWLQPNSITLLMEQMQQGEIEMLSVLPRRDDTTRASALFGTLRYLWELLLAFSHRPPASSALWCIKRELLLGLSKGLPLYAVSVQPEVHIAKQLQQTKQYHYFIGRPELGVRYEKRWMSQINTAERVYYPLFGHSFISTLFGIAMLSSLVLPFALFGWSFVASDALLRFAALCLVVVTYGWFGLFTVRTYSGSLRTLRVVLAPYVLLQDTFLLAWSFLRHTTNSVSWKGRSVTAQPVHPSHYSIDE